MRVTVSSRNKVRELRARHNITQEKLSSFLGIKVDSYRKKEKEVMVWKEHEMHLVVYFFNHFYGEQLTLDEIFEADIIEIENE